MIPEPSDANFYLQYILRKAFDCSPGGKVCGAYHTFFLGWFEQVASKALPAALHPLATERTIFGWCGLLLD